MPARTGLTPLKLSLAYAAIGSLWIVVTDRLVETGTDATFVSFVLHSGKGLLFIAVTATALHWLARRFQIRATERARELEESSARNESARRMYATLSAVNRRIIRPVERASLNQAMCNALVEPGGFRSAWIGRVADRTVTIIAHAGPEPATRFELPEACRKTDAIAPIHDAIVGHRAVVCHELFHEGTGPLDVYVRDTGARKMVVIPFHPDTADPKVLAVYSRHTDAFGPEIVGMLTELVADLEHGLEVIAERERRTSAELALRASEERYRLVAENSQDVIWILSRDAKLQYISPSIQRLLGYAPAQIMDMEFSKVFTADTLRRVEQEMKVGFGELERTGQMRSRLFEAEQVRADGTTVWTEIHTMDFHDDSGRWIGVLGVTRDITQRRAAETALASEVSRCRALLDVSVDGIQIVDLDGRLLDANEIFLRERGLTRDMIPQLTIENWNVEMNPEQLRARLDSISAEPLLFETLHRRTDGTIFPVEARAKRVEIDGRAMIYCTTRDITERKALEQRLLRAQRLESVGLIASGIAHDLNNVLTPILLSTGLLEMRYNGPDDRTLLDPIEAAARRGSNIVQQILTFARGAEGQRVAVEPKILLKELSNLIRETFPRSIAHRLEVSSDAGSIIGDPTQLHQVFLNLAVNARDAMPDGGTLTIDARNRRFDEDDVRQMPSGRPGDYVCITVADTGTGMSHEVLDHLFEPFFTTKPRGRGTGLGLSTVHGLVRGHGGFVDVQSSLGRGSEFRVFLPVAPAGLSVDVAPPRQQARQLGHGEYVLVVDDEAAILTVISSVLQRHGFLPLTASDGREALAAFDQHAGKIALVVTDVMMPRFDGVRLATEVRRRSKSLPIIAMSGMISPTPDDESRQQLGALGVTTILDKPYGETELLRAIEAALPSLVSEK